MNAWLACAAALLFGIGLAHSGLGERYILMRLLRRPDLPQLFGSDLFTRRTLRFAWHLTTVAWWGAAAVVLVLGASEPGQVAHRVGHVVAATFLASAAVALVGSRGRHLSWLVFLAIAAATWLGVRQ